jgi:hypothetical protein
VEIAVTRRSCNRKAAPADEEVDLDQVDVAQAQQVLPPRQVVVTTRSRLVRRNEELDDFDQLAFWTMEDFDRDFAILLERYQLDDLWLDSQRALSRSGHSRPRGSVVQPPRDRDIGPKRADLLGGDSTRCSRSSIRAT